MSDNENSSNLRMDAYYYGFDRTGVIEVDLILSAVATAGKAFHGTDQWNDEAGIWPPHEGETPAIWIQNAAAKAASEFNALRAQLSEAQARLAAWPASKESLKGERELAEYAYSVTAHDFERNPIGSRDWTLFWSGWQRNNEARNEAAPVSPAAQAMCGCGDTFGEGSVCANCLCGKYVEAGQARLATGDRYCCMCGHAICEHCKADDAPVSPAAQEAQAVADEHVAWLRYNDHNGKRPTTLHLCDNDDPGAFKVFRASPPVADDVVRDAERWRWGCKNARWIRHEHEAYVAIPVARDANLSCYALRVGEVDLAMKVSAMRAAQQQKAGGA